MASQFTIYSSSDASGPGLLTGQAGTLLTLLQACLVDGYVGKAAAGWTKPMADSGNCGAYTQGAGAGLNLFVNDNGPNVTSTYKEAWACGWETLAGIAAPVGSGTGQFPTPAQLLTTGHVVWRKSASADATGRQWVLFADSSTFMLFMANGDATGAYSCAIFGDLFSLKGVSDAYRCFIAGRSVENLAGGNSSTILYEGMDITPGYTNMSPLQNIGSTSGTSSRYVARTYGGGGTSVSITVVGDLSLASIGNYRAVLQGVVQTPNGPDNSFYLSPLRISEIPTATIRGRVRGLYQVCHPVANFADGQTFAGGGDYAGKTFQIVSTGPNGGFWAVETSATVETNA